MATNTDADGGQSGNSRQTQMEEQSAMLPELPNEVWTLVLGKLEAVGDFGRLQQVSCPFNAAITDVGWTKIKKIVTDYRRHLNVLIRVNEQELFLPMEKRVQLVAELAKKAINITDVVVVIRPGPINERKAPLIEEYVEFLGRALDKLATSSMEIRCFEIVGDLIHLTPMFPSLAQFIHANIETLEKVSIWDCCFLRHQGLAPIQFPAELLQAIQQCSQLENASILAYAPRFSVPLFESLINGKSHLKTLDITGDASCAPAILDLEAQLVKFTCCSELLRNYVAELGRRGLSATDQHPLRTVKELTVGRGLLPSFSMMPNLEHLDFHMGIKDVQEEVIPFVSRFLTDYMFTPDGQKVLMCKIRSLAGANSAQELANKVKGEFFCQTMVKATEDGSAEITFSRGKAHLIFRVADLPVVEDESDEDDEGSDGDA